MIRGYDFNRVVDSGRFTPGPNDIIITGNTVEHASIVLSWLAERNIRCPVFFSPYRWAQNNRVAAGMWKAEILQRLGVAEFIEDDELQAQIILAACPATRVIMAGVTA